MNWVIDVFRTSVGKKLMMAVTGLCFIIFLIAHLGGNMTIFGGKDYFHAYVEHLHGWEPIIKIAELILLTLALIHIITGLILFYENFKARPQKYSVKKDAGGRSIGSQTMPYTGLFILLFLIYHLVDFHFADQTSRNLFQIMHDSFSNPVIFIFYIVAMAMAAVHVSHGFWSAFQTIGADHPKYTPAIKGLGLLFSVVVGIGFGFLPIYIILFA